MRLFSFILLAWVSMTCTPPLETPDPTTNQTPATWQVSGQVAGLDGSLVLRLNDAHDLTVAANGPFEFSESLADSAAYEVTLSSWPETQTCLVENGEGSLDLSNPPSILVTCTTLSGPELCALREPLPVLLIGNSYTHQHDVPGLVESIACSLGFNVAAEKSTSGGFRFLDHVSHQPTLDLIDSKPWHAVILQNQSQVPAWRPSDLETGSLPHAETLVNLVAANDPTSLIVYYQTWGREAGDQANCGYYPKVCDFAGHTEALAEGYAQYQAATGGLIAPVGTAWKAVVDDPAAPFDSAELWAGDGSHATLYGGYLAALVLVGTLFETAVSGADGAGTLSAEDVAYLQSIVDSMS